MEKLKLDLSKFSNEEILSREELRRVLGGATQSSTGSDGNCSITQECEGEAENVSCNGQGGDCKFVTNDGVKGVQCDGDTPNYCSKQVEELI